MIILFTTDGINYRTVLQGFVGLKAEILLDKDNVVSGDIVSVNTDGIVLNIGSSSKPKESLATWDKIRRVEIVGIVPEATE